MTARAALARFAVSSTTTTGLPGPAQIERLPDFMAALTTAGPPVTSSTRTSGWAISSRADSSVGFGTAVTVLTLWFDDLAFRSYPKFTSRLKLACYAAVEQVIYRQLTIVWRLWGIRLFLMGRTEWGQQVRKGFTTS